MWRCKNCNETEFNQILLNKFVYEGCEFDINGYVLLDYRKKSDDFIVKIKCMNCLCVGKKIDDIAVFKK